VETLQVLRYELVDRRPYKFDPGTKKLEL
jgi:hypothetical protein